MNDILHNVTLLIGGAVLTVDSERRLLDPGMVAIQDDRIIAIGPPDELLKQYPNARTVDLRHTVILPGLVDTHGHAGHGLTKALSDGNDDWLEVVADLYFMNSDDEFWRAESRLSALEHLEFGVTTSLSMTGSNPRVDDPRYAVAAQTGYAELGLRHIVALGPPNQPYPREYRDLACDELQSVDLDRMLRTTADAIDLLNGKENGRISVFVGPSAIVDSMNDDGSATELSITAMREAHRLAIDKGVNIHAHAYAGQIAAAAASYPDILSTDLTLAHCAGISLEEVQIMADTGVHATHGPLTHAFASARFPVTEALEAGVNVVISTDGSGPDRSFDLLSQGRIAAQLQRAYFADTSIMPAGKILEMMTIDAARALGMEHEIGSLEVGKKADIIALNLHSARMSPRMMLLERVVYVGSGLDVDFVMVDGQVLMQGRNFDAIDVDQILEDASLAATKAIQRAGLEDVLKSHPNTWGNARY